MILLQRPSPATYKWVTIAALPLWLGTGQHHQSTIYCCESCGNPSWRRLVEGEPAFTIASHPCAMCDGYFPIIDSDFEGLRLGATPEAREALALLALAHPRPTIRTYLHSYQRTHHHDRLVN